MALSNLFRTTFRISDLSRILKFATVDKTTCIGYVKHNISSPVKSVQVMATVVANIEYVESKELKK